ncbi:hypothetical protein KIN20_030569 [Parelaphostrongylus tenuis]|uniref:Uncharacterized protein n=1 Tax=Parelaphostrongylus tenuis TaxID=148309 RepID=A0AAD5R3Y5_PARTN|nr:hypothetical protein KIN20_030569 [Parelaphostrongylus tenuis]
MVKVPVKGSDQGEVLAGETARFPAAEQQKNKGLSSEEVVKKICFSSGCDVASLPISGDITISDQEYLDQLIRDKGDLRAPHAAPFRHLTRLIDKDKFHSPAYSINEDLHINITAL